MKGFVSIVFAFALVAMSMLQARAQTRACVKSDFEAAVEMASAKLRDLTARNKARFQHKLRQLKEKRGWTTDEFLKQAVIYVQDETIAALDQRSGQLLARVNTMGADGGDGGQPDCELLDELRTTMKALVQAQVDKWAHMFAKLQRALKQPARQRNREASD